MEEVFKYIPVVGWLSVAGMFLLYRLFDEAQDRSMNNRWKFRHKFMNSGAAWKRKWAMSKRGELLLFEPKWYYLGTICPYKERFFLSSTALVFLTDGEHLFQWFKNRAVELAFVPFSWWLVLAALIGNLIGSRIKEKLPGWQ